MSDQPQPATSPAVPAESSHPKSASWADDESDDEASAREFQAAMTPRKGGVSSSGAVAAIDKAREECKS